MSGPMHVFHVEFQYVEGGQISGRVVWAESAWDALRFIRDIPLGQDEAIPIRATRLIPDRIFEYSLKEREP